MLEQDILQKDIPALYDISIGAVKTDLLIKVRGDARAQLELNMLSPSQISRYKYFQESFKLPEFVFPTDSNNWGFGSVLSTVPETLGEWVAYKCSMPKASNDDKYSPVEYQQRFATSATLAELFKVLNSLHTGIDLGLFQLLTPKLTVGLNGTRLMASLGVTLGHSIVPWLNQQRNGSREGGIEEIMRINDECIRGRKITDSGREFMFMFREAKRINLVVPGSACGLDEGWGYEKDSPNGYELTPHNVDIPLQQLTLLMGIAAMSDAARKIGL